MAIQTSGPIVEETTPASDMERYVSDFLARDDLTPYVPTFITLAEDWFNYGHDDMPALRLREMEAIDTLTPEDGVCELPAGFLQHIRAVDVGGSRRPLNYITPDAAEARYPSRAAGTACEFTIIGSSIHTFPATSSDIELTYYRKIPDLATNRTNWLAEKAPSLYMRAALAVAADFVKDTDEFQKQFMLVKALAAGLNRSDVVGKYARAGVTIRGCTP